MLRTYWYSYIETTKTHFINVECLQGTFNLPFKTKNNIFYNNRVFLDIREFQKLRFYGNGQKDD